MTPKTARAVSRAVAPEGDDDAADFLRAQVRRIPPPLGFGVRALARFFSLAPTAGRLRRWRRSRLSPLRDFAAMCAALVRFSQHSRSGHENESGE